ncbi:Retrovirus-related Pol polyprotein from transposon 17.6, partial [Mucuna pruriens]
MSGLVEVRKALVTSNWCIPQLKMEARANIVLTVVILATGPQIGKHSHVIAYASCTLDSAQANYSTTEKELLTILFALDKFHSYLLGSKIIVFSDHAALKFLLKKPDAKLRLIRWMLLLQEFDIEIKDKSGAENLVTNHLSRIEKRIDHLPIRDDFLDEQLMQLDGRHYRSHQTVRKVLDSEFYWPTIFKNAHHFVTTCEQCQRLGVAITRKHEMPQHPILLAIDYVSRLVEAKATKTNDAKVVVDFVANPNRKNWSRLLEDALWAHRMTYQTSLGMSPYRIVFGKACHLLVGIEHHAYWATKRCNLAFDQVSNERKLQLQELEELRLEAYDNSKVYKEKVKCFYDNMILRKEFKVGQKELLFNSHLKLIVGKLRSKWDGPFVITNVFPYGAFEIRNMAIDKTFKVNGHQLKLFHKCPTMMEGDVEDPSLLITSLKWKTMITLTLRAKGALELFWEWVLHKCESDTPRGRIFKLLHDFNSEYDLVEVHTLGKEKLLSLSEDLATGRMIGIAKEQVQEVKLKKLIIEKAHNEAGEKDRYYGKQYQRTTLVPQQVQLFEQK